MDSKTSFITGASAGMGKIYAEQLAEAGHNLVITARREEKLQSLANELMNSHDVDVDVIAADLVTIEGITKIKDAIETCEDPFYLVNNAGFGIPAGFLEVPIEKHNQMIKLHVNAVTELSYTILPKLQELDRGGIITVSSMAAFAGEGVYSGTKSYQVKLMKRLHNITEGTNIVCQALCPGYVKTEFHQTEEYKKRDVNAYDKVSDWLWLDAEYVVSTSLKAAKKRKTVVIPSIRYKLIKFASNFLPI